MKEYYRKEFFLQNDTVTVQHIKGDGICPTHTHDFFEFVYVSKGEGMHVIDGISYPVKKGSLLFINFGQTHSIETTGGEYYNILLLPEYIGTELARETAAVYDLFSLVLENGDSRCCVNFYGSEIEETEMIVRMLYEEYCADSEERRAALSDLIHLLTIKVLRKVRKRAETKSFGHMSEILDWLKAHYAENPTLSGVSEKFFYNSSYFSRLFKRFTGEGFNAYVNTLKINQALGLIESTDLTMEEIADKVGYGDVKNFYAQFKKLTGATPGAFRNKSKKK